MIYNLPKPKYQDINIKTIIYHQGNISPLEPRNLTTAGSEIRNIAEAQDKNLKTAFMNIIEIHKKEKNESLKEIYKTQRSSGRKLIK